jgi:hypothetical protein
MRLVLESGCQLSAQCVSDLRLGCTLTVN